MEPSLECMEAATLALFSVSPKTADQKLSRQQIDSTLSRRGLDIWTSSVYYI